MFIFFFLFALFLLDIFALSGFDEISFYLVIIFPISALLTHFISKKKIGVPKGSMPFVFFILLSTASVFTAVNKQQALETVITYVGVYLVFILAYNNKSYFEHHLKKYVMFSSVVFILIFLANNILSLNLFTTGSSLFYYYGHNQLGNILILPFLLSFPRPHSLLFFIFILVSYSRTTFLSLFLTFIWQFKEKHAKNLYSVLSVIAVFLVASITVTGVDFFSKPKTLLGSREMYFNYAKEAIMENPVFGVGAGNFYYTASRLQTNHNENTASSHNIILDVFAENGIIAGLLFTAFLLYLFRNSRRSLYFYSFIALTIVFLFDFTHLFPSFLVLWFFLAGLVVEDERTFKLNPWIPVLLLLIYQPVLMGRLFYNLKMYEKAKAVYPLYKDAYPKLIVYAIEKGDNIKAREYLKDYSLIFGEDFDSTLKIARYYEYVGDFDQSRDFYGKTLLLRPFFVVADQIVLDKFHILSVTKVNVREGREMTGQLLDRILGRIPLSHRDKNPIFDSILDYCYANKLKCYNIEI